MAAVGALCFIGPSAAVWAPTQEGFGLSGDVDGLYPGVETTVQATVTNPHAFAIKVTSVSVASLDASPQCPGSLLAVGDLTSTVDIPAGQTGIVPLTVRLDPLTPNACQGATWPLEFSGTAVETGSGGEAAPAPSGPSASGQSGGGGRGLPLTGANAVGLTAIGAALLAAGVAARVAARRRDDRQVDVSSSG